MTTSVNGIHHITALAGDPQRNFNFYTKVLGLRLVKRTVNYDAPEVYHLYYGDEPGHPGTLLTFFPFPDASRGKRGTGEVSAVMFQVPSGSVEYWSERLARSGIHFDGPASRFGEVLISFEDPEGMNIDFVFSDRPSAYQHWPENPVAEPHAIRKFHGATFLLSEQEHTRHVIVETLGFRYAAQEGERYRYLTGEGESEGIIDMVIAPSIPRARQSAGSVHHIAWRAADDNEHERWRTRVMESGLDVTPIAERNYFRSIYFREPGGILFEIATDPPGFTVDESLVELGSHLRLPAWLDQRRDTIERNLPPLQD